MKYSRTNKSTNEQNAVLLKGDIYKYIANNSSLTQEQVKECFTTYRNMLEGIFNSECFDSNIEIPIPFIGVFYFSIRHGRKKGSTYKMPNKFTNEVYEVTLDEDETDYPNLKFRISKGLRDIVKVRFGRKP